MIKMASTNIDVNGIPYEEAIQEEGRHHVYTRHAKGRTKNESLALNATFKANALLIECEPLDQSLVRKLQNQQMKVEEMTLQVAERRKRVPEQVKMLLDDAIKRQSALADRIEFESQEEVHENVEQSRRMVPSCRLQDGRVLCENCALTVVAPPFDCP
jgi:Zn finger protein HypA/HybF involved in hydrogenase expression